MTLFYNSAQAMFDAIGGSQAIIEFTPDGKIITANANFLKTMGYGLSEIAGQHHRIFCDPAYARGSEYTNFWKELAEGHYRSGEFKRVTRTGDMVWLQATYNPVRGRDGQIVKIVKIAADITATKHQSLEDAGKIKAIYQSQAVIAFTPDGTILDANENFLKALGYHREELVGKPHRMLCEPAFANSAEYGQLWRELNAGRFVAGEYKRIGKGGRDVYIQASYNPITDDIGQVIGVVKFAFDITDVVKRRLSNAALGHEINTDLGGVLDQIARANEMANTASAASIETGAIVNSVAAASEELSQSVRDISQSMGHARESVQNVFKFAEDANSSASGLNDSANSMNSVVALIQNIASQINLLALNATIESARAGEAGKGFAVVASEVKSLANQAAHSTKTIAEEITRMQGVSNGVVEALSLISSHMNDVLENVASVAGAIEQQTAATGEISANMQSAVTAVHEIGEGLVHITHTFTNVADASEQVKQRVETLVA